VIRALRDLIVTYAGPMPPGLPGAGWRVWVLTAGPSFVLAVWSNQIAPLRASTIDSSK